MPPLLRPVRVVLAVIGAVLIVGAVFYGIESLANGAPPNPNQSSCGPASLTDSAASYVVEYGAPGSCPSPNGITVDNIGRVWFVEQNTSELAVFYPSWHNFTLYQLPVVQPITWSLTTTLDGSVWLTDANSSEIIRFDPTTLNFTQFKLSAVSFPLQIVRGPDGAVWFSELYGHRIGRIQLDNGMLNEYPTPNNDTAPSGIVFDSNGTLWVSMVSFNQSVPNTVATLDPANGTYHYFDMPAPISQPTGIAVDRSGNVWFAEHGPSLLGRFNPATGELVQIATSAKASTTTTLPYWLVEDNLGYIWFNEHEANRIARLDPSQMTLVEYDIPSRVPSYDNISNALTVTFGGGSLWFTELTTGRIGMVNGSVSSDVSLSAPSSFNISTSTILHLNLTVSGRYSGVFGLEATDSEQASGAPKNFSVSFNSPVSTLSGKPATFDVEATVIVTGSPLLGSYYFTLTAREPGVAFSKISVARVVSPP